MGDFFFTGGFKGTTNEMQCSRYTLACRVHGSISKQWLEGNSNQFKLLIKPLLNDKKMIICAKIVKTLGIEPHSEGETMRLAICGCIMESVESSFPSVLNVDGMVSTEPVLIKAR